jgi:hypothetical protein
MGRRPFNKEEKILSDTRRLKRQREYNKKYRPLRKAIATYHLIMERFLYTDTKEFRLACYDQLIKDMKRVKSREETVYVEPAKQEEILTLHNSKKEKRTKVYDFENTQRWNMKLVG